MSSQNDLVREEDFRVNLTSYLYQTDLLLLFSWRGCKHGYDFQLETEVKDAEKFDDLVFSYEHGGKKYVTYLQAKYSKDVSKRWNYQDFAADRNIAIGNLKKYFTSFRKINQKFSDKIAENFILCSNIAFERLKLKNFGNSENDFLEFVETTQDINLKTEKNIKRDMFHGFEGDVYWKTYSILNISSEIYEKLLKTTNLQILAEELANCIINRRKKADSNVVEMSMENFWFSKYRQALIKENVIEMDQQVLTFSTSFTEGKKTRAKETILLKKENIKYDLLDFQKEFKKQYEKRTSLPMENIIFNKIVMNYYCNNIRSTTKTFEIENNDALISLASSLINVSLKTCAEMDNLFIKYFDFIKRALTTNKRIGFTNNFIKGKNIKDKATEFRMLLLKQLEKNKLKILESHAFQISETFYEAFHCEENLENTNVEYLHEKLVDHLVFKTPFDGALLSKANFPIFKNMFVSSEENKVFFKNNFLKNLNLATNDEKFRKQLLETYFQKILQMKEIKFKFNVREMDDLISNIQNCVKGDDKNNIFYHKDKEMEMKLLIKSLNGFVFEKLDKDYIAFTESFTNETLEEIRQFRAKLMKSLNITDLTTLKKFRFEMPDITFCSGSFDENEDLIQEINDFCQKFIIVTSPNVYGLIDCIKNEIGKHYDRQVADNAKDKYVQKILNFAMGYEGQYITHKIIAQFMEDIVTQTKFHEIEHISAQYLTELRTYEIFFQRNYHLDLMNFINQKKKVFHIITEDTILTAIKLVKILQNTNGIIFCTLSSLLKSKASAIRAFESKYVKMLIIVEDIFFEETFCLKILSIVQMNEEKQLILIVNETSTITDIVKNNINLVGNFSYVDKWLFNQLTEDMQTSLLEKEIIFNNDKIILGSLINERIFFEALHGNSLMELIDDKQISILGTSKSSYENNVKCYIEREVHLIEINDKFFDEMKRLVNDKFFDEMKRLVDHLFAIEGEKEKVYNFLKIKGINANRVYEMNLFENIAKKTFKKPCFIILNPDTAEKEFKKLSKDFDFSVHWLKLLDKKLIWFNSSPSRKMSLQLSFYLFPTKYDNIPSLLEFCIDRSSLKMQENNFFELVSTSNITLFCDTAGMGKSTFLSSYIEKKFNQNMWTLRIDLNEHIQLLSNLQTDIKNDTTKFNFKYFNAASQNYDEIILRVYSKNQYNSRFQSKMLIKYLNENFLNFLENYLIPSNNLIFENYVFLYLFYKGRVLIIFDGFDEINPIYADLVLEIIENIRKHTENKIWITSRPCFQTTLETKFNTFAYTLKPLSEEQQMEYLINIWKRKWDGHLNDLLDNGFKQYASALMHQFQEFVGEEYNKFMGIPLKIKMMAEIFQENQKYNNEEQWLESFDHSNIVQLFEHIYKNKNEWLGCFDYLKGLIQDEAFKCDTKLSNQNLNLFKLYNMFVQKIFYRFINEKFKAGNIKNYEGKLRKIFINYQHNIHRLLGFLQLTNEYKDDLESEIHNLLKPKNRNLINEWKKDFNKGVENLGFVVKLLNYEQPLFDHLTYAEYFCANFLMEELENFPENREDVFRILNKQLESSVPVFQYCTKYILEHQIGRTELIFLLNYESPIKFSMKYGLINCVNFFINDSIFNDGFPYQDEFGKTLLHYAAGNAHLNVIFYILFPALSVFAQKNNVSYISLMQKFSNLLDIIGKKAIDYAYSNKNNFNMLGELENALNSIVKLKTNIFKIEKEWSENVFLRSIFNSDSKTLLSTTTNLCYEHLQTLMQTFSYGTIKKLLNFLPMDVILSLSTNIPFNVYDNIAARHDLTVEEKFKIFVLFWHKFAKKLTAESVLLAAIENECSTLFEKLFYFHIKQELMHDIIKELLQKCVNVAFKLRNIFIIRFFYGKPVYCSFKLVNAISEKTSFEIIQYLIRTAKCNVNERNEHRQTPILIALHANYAYDEIKFLYDNKSDINAEDENCISAWKWVVVKNKDDLIKMFYKTAEISDSFAVTLKDYFNPYTFEINKKTKKKSRLHHAVIEKDLMHVRFLLQKGANVNTSDKNGKTPLHWACIRNLPRITAILLYYGAAYDKLDKNENEPLDYCNKNSEVYGIINNSKTDFTRTVQRHRLRRTLTDKQIRFKEYEGCYHANYNNYLTNARNKNDETLWHIAVKGKNVQVINFLSHSTTALQAINKKNTNGNTALHCAAIKGHNKILLKLLKNGIYYDIKNKNNETALDIAKNNNHQNTIYILQKVELLFSMTKKNSFRVTEQDHKLFKNWYKHTSNYKDKGGKTLLHYAIMTKNSQVSSRLIHYTADVNSRDNANHTPLYYAAIKNDFELVEKLLKNGAKYYEEDLKKMKNATCTPFFKNLNLLFSCAYNEDVKKIQKTLKSFKSNKNISLMVCTLDHKSKNLLHYALEMNNYDLVVKLLESGAVINERLHSSNKKIMQLLDNILEVFKCVEAKKYVSCSIINLIKRCRHNKIFTNVQVEKGSGFVSVNSYENRGKTLLYCAAMANDQDIVKWCIDNGANCIELDMSDYSSSRSSIRW